MIFPLQYSKQTHFHHTALCKLQEWWNTIKFTAKHRRLKNNFINNHQYKTHETDVRIKDRCWRFADKFLFTPSINVPELNFKRPIVTSQWHCVQTSVYPFPTVTEVSRLINIQLYVDWSTDTPIAPPPKIVSYQSRAHNVFYFAFII